MEVYWNKTSPTLLSRGASITTLFEVLFVSMESEDYRCGVRPCLGRHVNQPFGDNAVHLPFIGREVFRIVLSDVPPRVLIVRSGGIIVLGASVSVLQKL